MSQKLLFLAQSFSAINFFISGCTAIIWVSPCLSRLASSNHKCISRHRLGGNRPCCFSWISPEPLLVQSTRSSLYFQGQHFDVFSYKQMKSTRKNVSDITYSVTSCYWIFSRDPAYVWQSLIPHLCMYIYVITKFWLCEIGLDKTSCQPDDVLTLALTGGGGWCTPPPRFFADNEKTAARSVNMNLFWIVSVRQIDFRSFFVT